MLKAKSKRKTRRTAVKKLKYADLNAVCKDVDTMRRIALMWSHNFMKLAAIHDPDLTVEDVKELKHLLDFIPYFANRISGGINLLAEQYGISLKPVSKG